MAFVIKQTVDLSQWWDGCSIILSSLSTKEAQDLSTKFTSLDPEDEKTQAEVFDFIRTKFISGTAENEKGEKVELKPSDLEDLPIEVYKLLVKNLAGSPDPN